MTDCNFIIGGWVDVKDELAGQLQGAAVQIEVLQTQVRDMQAHHWDELQRTKHTESQVHTQLTPSEYF